MAKITKEDIVASLKEMKILEVQELIELVETTFGVKAAAVAAAPSADAGGAKDAAPSTMTVVLKNAGQAKVAVIKVIREITGLGLMEAKAIADSAPKSVLENIKVDDAKKFEAMLKEAGAEVELK